MKAVFSALTRLALRFRAITLALMVILSIAGIIAVTQLRQELIPAVAFPQTIILAQASGMTSEQVLNVLTNRLETALDEIPEIVNLESTTTGTFGAVITARNNFGDNPVRLRNRIRETLDTVYLPLRRIAPPEGVAGNDFAADLLDDLTADVLVYLQETDANFLFQLTPDTWGRFSDETVRGVLGYLAGEFQVTPEGTSALQRLIEQEIVPALVNLDAVASVSISGGQLLPDEMGAETANAASTAEAGDVPTEARSLLLGLSPEVWEVVAPRVGLTALDESAVEALIEDAAVIGETAPALPSNWQIDRFKDATDLVEMRTLTRTIGSVINDFAQTGEIVGALGQTDDLTPDTIAQMLAIDPTLVEYFDAEQLAALPADVFAALPDDFIANLDGFTRDALAASALAVSITGETAQPDPVDLPQPWRIAPPQLITFSFDDLPLATFSVSGTGAALTDIPLESALENDTETAADTAETAQDTASETVEIPEGPALSFAFGFLGIALGIELDTADDLIDLQLPENLAEQFGATSLDAASLFNFLLLLDNPDAIPQGTAVPSIPGGAAAIIGGITPEVVAFLEQYDPGFIAALSPGVFDAFSDDVLGLPAAAPPLDAVWDTLAQQPQFRDQGLQTAADIVTLGAGEASRILNTIDETVPERFAGYEVRLFDSLTPAALRYFAAQEPEFYARIHPEVLLKLSPATLTSLPETLLEGLDDGLTTQIAAIAAGENPSAAETLAALYATDVPPADPNAPALNAEWQFIGDFLGAELDTADDFRRFFPTASGFINGLFNTAQGASFAPNLLGGLSAEAITYIAEQEEGFYDALRIEALRLLTADVLATLPAPIQERVTSGEQPFEPTAAVTRTNGNSSLFITVYKSRDANTVEAYHNAEAIMDRIDEEDESIRVSVSFEQASFIEESISGVAREGGLGAVFAVVVILVFLSSGIWKRSPRVIVGFILTALFAGLLAALVFSNAELAGNDINMAWSMVDVVVRVLLIAGIVIGLAVAFYPGNLPRPAWRSTIVTAVSIPLSILIAMALMRWLPGTVNSALAPIAEGSSFLTFVLRLFPQSLTINIMTLSGLTVAIGRVVDDSIVVLENIFREIQSGKPKRQAIIDGTRDVSVAIFAATVITVVVFLPLGLTGGIIGEFFLPFGLAVTYSLLASFIVAITAVPVVAYLLLDVDEITQESQAHAGVEEGGLERIYGRALRWALDTPLHRALVLVFSVLSLVVGGALFGTRPQAFLPAFGEPQIAVAVDLPAGTPILDTNARVIEFENYLRSEVPEGEISTVQSIIGSSGFSFTNLLLGTSSVTQNIANITLFVEDGERLDALAGEIRTRADAIFGEGNATVSAASLSEQGFGGFALVVSGPQADLEATDGQIIEALNNVDGLANVSSNLSGLTGDTGENTPATYIRIDQQSAARYTGELETENTLGVTNLAKEALFNLPNLPASLTVSEGFETRLQTEGFANLFIAMGIAIAIVIVLLIITFGSLVHWISIILSIIVAPVGAAIALTLTNRVLGISALIGLLMLIGIVVTNAVVLIDRVQSNRRERNMPVREALIEAGSRRLRPILMTAIATIMALLPLAIGLSRGAIIASELGTVVIGGLFSSTILTLIVVPVAYLLLTPLNDAIEGIFRRR